MNKQINYTHLAFALLMSLGTVSIIPKMNAESPMTAFSSKELGEVCAKINYYISEIDQKVLKSFQNKSCTTSYEKRVKLFGSIIHEMNQEVFAPIKNKTQTSSAPTDIALNKAALEIHEGLNSFYKTMTSYANGCRYPGLQLKIALDFKKELDGLKQRISKVIPQLQKIAQTVPAIDTTTKSELIAMMQALHKIVSTQGNPIEAINIIKYVYYDCKG